ncbi:MAG: rRNA maturation RNase YbeY [Pirellulales bacterium]
MEVTNRQTNHEIDEARLIEGVRAVWRAEGKTPAEINVAVVDADEIWRLNQRFLRHDYTTDVLSFCLEQSPDGLSGEIVVSADMAASMAPRFGWSIGDELLLYVIHGTLHLAGYDDQTPPDAAIMRQLEQRYLGELGVAQPTAVSGDGRVGRRAGGGLAVESLSHGGAHS